jgi:hypothetical protein
MLSEKLSLKNGFKIRLGDRIVCQHVRPITPKNMMEDLHYMLNHNGEVNPAAYSQTEFIVDSPEKTCPDCGKIWGINT